MEKTSVRILFGERKTKLCFEMRRLKKMMLMSLNILKIVAVVASLVMCYRSFKQLYIYFIYIFQILHCAYFFTFVAEKRKYCGAEDVQCVLGRVTAYRLQGCRVDNFGDP